MHQEADPGALRFSAGLPSARKQQETGGGRRAGRVAGGEGGWSVRSSRSFISSSSDNGSIFLDRSFCQQPPPLGLRSSPHDYTPFLPSVPQTQERKPNLLLPTPLRFTLPTSVKSSFAGPSKGNTISCWTWNDTPSLCDRCGH